MNIKRQDEIMTSINMKEVFEVDNGRIEESGMSPFVADHIDQISEITGYDLEVVDKEVFVGDFRADIICKDVNTNDIVVIENMIDKTDHDHVGKSLTYLANLNAKAIVLICDTVRSEHAKAFDWLNDNTGSEYNFYMLELKFNKIIASNESFYTFNTIVMPTFENKFANDVKRDKSENRLHIENVLGEILEKISTRVPKAKWDSPSKKDFIWFWGNSKCWASLLVNKTRNPIFEIVYDLNACNKEDAEKYENFINALMQTLNTKYGYEFKYDIGQGKAKRKVRFTTQLSIDTDVDEIISIIININNELKK